jgi:hypothetical protein
MRMVVEPVPEATLSSSTEISVLDSTSMTLPSKNVMSTYPSLPVFRLSPVPNSIPEIAAIQPEEPCRKTWTSPSRPERAAVSAVDAARVAVGIAVGFGSLAAFFPQPTAVITTAITRITDIHLDTFIYLIYLIFLATNHVRKYTR